MKKILTLTLGILLSFLGYSQCTINPACFGTGIKDPSAQITVNSTTSGFLIPRMTEVQKDDISAPATGLLVYQTNSTPGFYYYTGAIWSLLGGGGSSLWTETNNTLSPTSSSAFRVDYNGYSNILDSINMLGFATIPMVGGYDSAGTGLFINGIGRYSDVELFDGLFLGFISADTSNYIQVSNEEISIGAYKNYSVVVDSGITGSTFMNIDYDNLQIGTYSNVTTNRSIIKIDSAVVNNTFFNASGEEISYKFSTDYLELVAHDSIVTVLRIKGGDALVTDSSAHPFIIGGGVGNGTGYNSNIYVTNSILAPRALDFTSTFEPTNGAYFLEGNYESTVGSGAEIMSGIMVAGAPQFIASVVLGGNAGLIGGDLITVDIVTDLANNSKGGDVSIAGGLIEDGAIKGQAEGGNVTAKGAILNSGNLDGGDIEFTIGAGDGASGVDGHILITPTLEDYANDAAAGVGGLVAGELYQNGGIVMIKQ